MTRPICIYHGNCADGFTAAWVVRRKLPGFEFHAGTYQDAPPDVTGRDVLMVDFSYKRPVLLEMAKSARSIVILDHHKSAAAALAGFREPAPFEAWTDDGFPLVEEDAEPVAALFDMERSGAGLAWDFLYADEKRPLLVDYVEDRDLWRFNLPFSREINAVIMSYNYTFTSWEALNSRLKTADDVPLVAGEGAALDRKHRKDVYELVASLQRPLRIGGHVVPAANLPHTMTSDAGHLMCGGIPDPHGAPADRIKPPFAACYWDSPKGVVFSLRSAWGGADVSEIAKRYGGGGHEHAAGFRVDRSDFGQFETGED